MATILRKSSRDNRASALMERSGDNNYLYQKIAGDIRQTIETGQLKPGMRLPSLDRLAETYKVNRITVRRAISDLRAEGLVHAVPAEGTYVSERSIKHKTSGLLSIGLVSHVLNPEGFGPYHIAIIAGIHEALENTDAHVVLMPEGHISNQEKIFDLMVRASLDGVIYLGGFDPVVLRRLVDKGPPAILVDCMMKGGLADAVLTDNHGGAHDAIVHLHGLGHRRIACIMGPENEPATRERLSGVRSAMADLSIAEGDMETVHSDFMRKGGRTAMQKLYSNKQRPTAVFCFNDEMAIGAIQFILEQGTLSIPRDISIMGFDDISPAMTINPHLTTIRVEKQMMGQLAVRQLIRRLRGEDTSPIHTSTVTPTQLIVRESTGPAPAQP